MKSKEIKKHLIDCDLSISALARKTGFSRAHISSVINGHWSSKNARNAISKVIGIDFWAEDALCARSCQDEKAVNQQDVGTLDCLVTKNKDVVRDRG